jgi:hypothetical protein
MAPLGDADGCYLRGPEPMDNIDFGIILVILLYIISEVRDIRKTVERIRDSAK